MKSFIKTLGIIVLAAVMVFSMAGCSSGGGEGDLNDPNNPNSPNNPNNPNYNPGSPNGTDEPPPPPPKVNAQVPVITNHPASKSYSLNEQATALSVVASSPDGGILSYQWYRYKKEGLAIVDEEQVVAATDRTYTPPTDVRSLWYYYVEVTNTIENNGDGGTKTALARSNTAYIAVAIVTLNITGITAYNKVYDGTTAATVVGASISVGGADVTLRQGTAEFAQSNVGTDIPITLIDWYIDGGDAGNYRLVIPENLKASITKAPGASVIAVTGTPTNNSITADEIIFTTGQSAEYARDVLNNKTATQLIWFDSPTFTGLSAVTDHYIYARSKGNNNYETGVLKVSDKITTLDPKVYFATDGGTDIEPKTVIKGGVVSYNSISTPTKDGYTFDFWYTNAAKTTPYDFQTTVSDNFTLYSKWVSNTEITRMKSEKDMVWIKGGWFTMGGTTGNEIPTHRVTLSGFWMGSHEVTQNEWIAVMGTNPSTFKQPVDGEEGTPGRLPVETVSWYDCLVFCNRLSMDDGLSPAYSINGKVNPNDWGVVGSSGWEAVTRVAGSTGYRLPTEAEWEYACRAGTTTLVSTGNEPGSDTGWYQANSGDKTHKVGLKPVLGNAWGLYDMHGNVMEWCWDWLVSYTTASQVNPDFSDISYKTPTYAQRMVRGGSFSTYVYSSGPRIRHSTGHQDNVPHPIGKDRETGLRLVRP